MIDTQKIALGQMTAGNYGNVSTSPVMQEFRVQSFVLDVSRIFPLAFNLQQIIKIK